MRITKIETHVLLVPDYDAEACSSAQDDIVVLIHALYASFVMLGLVAILLAVSLSAHPETVVAPLATWFSIGDLNLGWAFRRSRP